MLELETGLLVFCGRVYIFHCQCDSTRLSLTGWRLRLLLENSEFGLTGTFKPSEMFFLFFLTLLQTEPPVISVSQVQLCLG